MPDANKKIVLDRFRLMGHIGKAVDTVRKEEHRELMASGDETLKGSTHLVPKLTKLPLRDERYFS